LATAHARNFTTTDILDVASLLTSWVAVHPRDTSPEVISKAAYHRVGARLAPDHLIVFEKSFPSRVAGSDGKSRA
jgi:hypothetical protein